MVKLHDADPSSLQIIQQRTELKRRRLYYLVDVGRIIRDYQIEKAQAERLDWTKLGIVARHVAAQENVPREELEKLLVLASATTARELPDKLGGLPSSDGKHCLAIYLSNNQYDVVRAALLAFGAKPKGKGLAGKDAAIARLAQAALEGSGTPS